MTISPIKKNQFVHLLQEPMIQCGKYSYTGIYYFIGKNVPLIDYMAIAQNYMSHFQW